MVQSLVSADKLNASFLWTRRIIPVVFLFCNWESMSERKFKFTSTNCKRILCDLGYSLDRVTSIRQFESATLRFFGKTIALLATGTVCFSNWPQLHIRNKWTALKFKLVSLLLVSTLEEYGIQTCVRASVIWLALAEPISWQQLVMTNKIKGAYRYKFQLYYLVNRQTSLQGFFILFVYFKLFRSLFLCYFFVYLIYLIWSYFKKKLYNMYVLDAHEICCQSFFVIDG